jgi:hypothetical protein
MGTGEPAGGSGFVLNEMASMSTYIPWSAPAQLSESHGGHTFVGALRDCVFSYLELNPVSRTEALIISDADVPLVGRRSGKILEAEEIEWLIDRLGSDHFLLRR